MMSLDKHYISYGRTGRLFVSLLAAVLAWAMILPVANAQARQQIPILVEGVVRNIQGEPVMGATIMISESTSFTVTDEYGNFSIEVPGAGSVINIEAEGFDILAVTISDGRFQELVIQYSEEGQGIRDRIFVPWGVSDRRSVTGAISSITHAELRKSPVMALSTAVSGRLSGFTVVQGAGSPGLDSYTWRIRGIRTLEDGGMNNMEKGGSGAPIIVVDGFERDFTDFDASEVESLSVLKDAAAVALYGIRGANGVILVTTKRGQANKRTIDVELSQGIVAPMRLPKMMGSYDYARLHNEARINDGLDPFWTADHLQRYQSGSSPLTHPDNDFYGEFIKDYTYQRKAALTMSGGNKAVRYFVSLSYNSQGGLYDRTNEGSLFETKSRYSRYNTRINLDIAVTQRLTAALNLSGRIEDRKYPFESESNIFNLLSNTPPNAYPLSFTGIDPSLNKEIFMLGGNSIYTTNPLGALSYRGFRDDTRRYYQMGVNLKYELDFITDGLNLNFQFDADGYNYYRVSKYLTYPVWDRRVQPDESVQYVRFNTPSSLTTSWGSDVMVYNGWNLYLTYDKDFGDSKFNALGMWRRFTTIYPQANQPDQKIEDFAIRTNYSMRNKYFLEGVLTLTGSENFFMTNKPRLLLPAISGAWIVSEEDFLSGVDFFQYIKLRASWGLTANDNYTFPDPNGIKYRYAYRDRWWSQNSQHAFGTALTYFNPIVREGVVPNRNITPEKGMMTNFGIETRQFNGHIYFSTEIGRASCRERV